MRPWKYETFFKGFHIRCFNQRSVPFRGLAHWYLNRRMTPLPRKWSTCNSLGKMPRIWKPLEPIHRTSVIPRTFSPGCVTQYVEAMVPGEVTPEEPEPHIRNSQGSYVRGLRCTKLKWEIRGIFDKDITLFFFQIKKIFLWHLIQSELVFHIHVM